MVAPLVMAILLLGGEPDRDSYAAQLSFEFHPPLEVFASSPSSGALERLSAVDRINKLVLSYEARSLPRGDYGWLIHGWFMVDSWLEHHSRGFLSQGFDLSGSRDQTAFNMLMSSSHIKSVSCRFFSIELRKTWPRHWTRSPISPP